MLTRCFYLFQTVGAEIAALCVCGFSQLVLSKSQASHLFFCSDLNTYPGAGTWFGPIKVPAIGCSGKDPAKETHDSSGTEKLL